MDRHIGNKATKYRLSGTNKSYVNRQANKKNKKKLSKIKNNIIFIFILIIIIFLSSIIFNRIFFNKNKNKKPEETTTQEVLKTSVIVDDIDISGMSKKEAYDAILKKYEWNMLANYNGEKYQIKNIIEVKLSQILDKIFKGDINKNHYDINFEGLDEDIDKEIDNISKKWEHKAKNAGLVSFNKETNEFIYEDGLDGIEIDKDKLKAKIKKAIEEKNFKAIIDVDAKTTKPEIVSKEDVKQKYKIIGTYTTKTTTNKDRNTNINISSLALDGIIIKPGEEFSFNATTGNRTLERGYKPAGAYVNGKLVEEPGGGVCQVSSTLYNAVIFSGLDTSERHAHSFEPSYVTPGEDAMVSYDGYAGPDMRFINTSKTAIAIRAKLVEQKLTVSIIGLPILDKDEKVYMTSKKVLEYDEPAPNYEDDPTLPAGQEILVKAGTKGSRWETNIIHKKGDNIISDKLLHYSTYKGKPSTIRKNLGSSNQAQTNPIPTSIMPEASLNQKETRHEEAKTTTEKQEQSNQKPVESKNKETQIQNSTQSVETTNSTEETIEANTEIR